MQVGETGKVVGIDHIDELINWSKDNVRKDNAALLDSGRIKFVVGDGRKGFPAVMQSNVSLLSGIDYG